VNLRFMTPAPRLDFAKAGAPLTGRGVVTLLLAAIAVFLAGASVAHAKSDLPDVDIMLVTEIHDTTGWLRMHQEVLRAPLGSSQTLGVILPARIDGNRAITVHNPRFATQIITAAGPQVVKVSVSGKVAGDEALQELTSLERAALDIQSGSVQNRLTLIYGLSEIIGNLLEMYLSRP
jgi:hypothetical protein